MIQLVWAIGLMNELSKSASRGMILPDRFDSELGIFMAKVTTGTGDTGYTGLLGEQRVAKYDPRPDTFGTVDEATSALGLARAVAQDQKVKEIIFRIQQELYILMAELATTPENYEKMGFRMTAEHVQWLEQVEESLKQA